MAACLLLAASTFTMTAGEDKTKPLGVVSLEPDKIRYVDGEAATFDVTVRNRTEALWQGTISAGIESGVAAVTDLGARPLALAPGEEAVIRWQCRIKLPDFGHCLHVRMIGADGKTLDEAREVFAVGEDYYNIGNYATSFLHGSITSAEQVRERTVKGLIRKRYVTAIEQYSTSPGCWGCLVPTRSWWFSGQNNYPETLVGEKLHIDVLHEVGVAVMIYNIRHSAGEAAIELLRKHPEYYAFRENGRILGCNNCKPVERTMEIAGRKFTESMESGTFSILSWDSDVQRETIRSTAESILFYNYDGIRWDGIGIENEYNYKGENVKNWNEDDINAEWHERMEQGIKAIAPQASVNYNFGPLILDTTKRYTKTHRVLGPGAYVLWESMRGHWKDPNHPYNTWEKFVEAVRYESDETRKEGNFQHFGWYGCKNVAQRTHTQAIISALGGHWDTWYECAYDDAGMRFGAYLWDRRIRLIGKPEEMISVNDPEGRLWWKSFAARLDDEGGKSLVITHLLNKPLLDRQDDVKTTAPQPQANVRVSLKIPDGKKLASVTWVDMDDSARGWIHPLTASPKDGGQEVLVPSVKFWSFLVWEIQ